MKRVYVKYIRVYVRQPKTLNVGNTILDTCMRKPAVEESSHLLLLFVLLLNDRSVETYLQTDLVLVLNQML